MKEIKGNIWDYHKKGYWIVITTNGTVKANGEVVMGRGVALQAKQKYPGLPYDLGQEILKVGNILHHWGQEGLLFFPVKHNWWERADIELIEKSTEELVDLFDNVISDYPTPVYLVRPGCGNGQLDWKDVKPILEKYLDDRFIVVERRQVMKKGRVIPKDTKPSTVDPDWNDELAATCPKHYPWACWMCNRKRGLTVPCLGREEIRND